MCMLYCALPQIGKWYGCTGSQAAARLAAAEAGVIIQQELVEVEKIEAAVQIAALEAELA
jgi:hypothetical protein